MANRENPIISDQMLRGILFGESSVQTKQGHEVRVNEDIIARTIPVTRDEAYTEAHQRDNDSLKPGEKPNNYLFELFLTSPESVLGCYDTNNGMVVVIDGLGNIYAGPRTESLISALKSQGFRDNVSILVPFSNDDRPANSDLWQRLQQLRESADIENRRVR